jgi:hypothetical protein
MGQWKRLESPKLRVPLEMREVTASGSDERTWEVQELRGGAMFKVVLGTDALPRGGRQARALTEAEAERAVCLSVEEAILSPPDKEPGMTYEIAVNRDEVDEAVHTAG